METSNLVGAPIVKELLNQKNYKPWCVLIKNYLLGQDLWDIIAEPSYPDEADSEYKVWRRKNAAALHAIQMSCGPEALLLIINIPSAKLAWDTLTKNYKHLWRSETSDYLVNMDYDQQYAPLYKAVQQGNWKAANEFLIAHPEGVSARISPFRGTALQTAALFGHSQIVEELIKLTSEEDMELKDVTGYTALAVAARTGLTQIAECMIKKNKNLVMIPTNSNLIPVTVAVVVGHLEMARYLYSVTPMEVLVPEKGYHGATLLNQCFISNTLLGER